MIQIECPVCTAWQKTTEKKCVKCGRVFKDRPVYVTRVTWRAPGGKERKDAIRHPGLSLSQVKLEHERRKEQARGAFKNFNQMLLSDVFQIHLDHLKAIDLPYAKKRIFWYQEIVDFFDNPPAKDLKRNQVIQYQNHLKTRSKGNGREGNLKNSSVNRVIRCAASAYNFVEPDAYNPFRKVPVLPEEPIIAYLTDEEESRLLEAARVTDRQFYDLVRMAILTGFRKNEILTLKRSEVDFGNNVIYRRTKGGKQVIKPLIPQVTDILLAVPENGTDYFWLGKRGAKVNIYPTFYKIKKLAGITKPFRWHDFRHHVAYKMIKKTGNLEGVRKTLNHDRISTTQRYAYMDLENLAQIMEECLSLPERPMLKVVK